MHEDELKNLLNQITAEVLRRSANLQETDRFLPQAQAPQQPATVVLVPSLVPFREKALKELIASYGNSLVFVTFAESFQADRQRVISAAAEDREKILEMTYAATNVVLLAPPLELIGHIAEAKDEGFLEYLFIRAQLWGKRVSIFLDFDLPTYRKTQFQESISDKLEALTSLGIPIVCYRKEAAMQPGDTRALITEMDVREAYNAGRRQVPCRLDSIITPLARDTANELGVEFISGEVW